MNRRGFLGLAAAAVAVPTWGEAASGDFSFLFLTDSHLQPELGAVDGTALAMKRAREVRGVDFAIQGGDHIMDALGVTKEVAVRNFDLYGKTEQDLGMKVHHTLGNHDVFGIYSASGTGESDPLYGKKLFEGRFGPTYYSFDHKGVHFVVLDSIGITADHHYEARIGQEQYDWLAGDLGKLRVGMPVIVTTHIPLVTAVPSYVAEGGKGFGWEQFHGGPAVVALLGKYNVLAVLQGHTHVNERVEWRGVPYITGGAVSGNWWHGARMGTVEGFTVVSVLGGKLSTRYLGSGWVSVAPEMG